VREKRAALSYWLLPFVSMAPQTPLLPSEEPLVEDAVILAEDDEQASGPPVGVPKRRKRKRKLLLLVVVLLLVLVALILRGGKGQGQPVAPSVPTQATYPVNPVPVPAATGTTSTGTTSTATTTTAVNPQASFAAAVKIVAVTLAHGGRPDAASLATKIARATGAQTSTDSLAPGIINVSIGTRGVELFRSAAGSVQAASATVPFAR